MKYSLVIWDFNGTVLDDLELSLNSINTVLKKRNLPLIEGKNAYRTFFKFPIEKYYEDLGMDFTKEPYKIPADEWVALYNSGADRVPLTNGVKEVIDKIAETKTPQIILSASEKEMLNAQLERAGLLSIFETVLGTDNVYGGGKISMAKRWAENTDTDLTNAVLIGDTDHDYQTATAIGCDCILYANGHMDRKRLEETGATVIDSMYNLFDIL